MIKYNQYLKENKYIDVDPLGEEDWDDDGYYMFVMTSRLMEPHYYIDFFNSEGYINNIDFGNNNPRYCDITYSIENGENQRTVYYPLIIDTKEQLDKADIIKYGSKMGATMGRTGSGIFIKKKLISKEEFLQITNEIFDIHSDELIPLIEEKIKRFQIQIEQLKDREYYLRNYLQQ